LIHGHVNYAPAVYTGTITWFEHTPPTFGDDDYNLWFAPDNGFGLTKQDAKGNNRNRQGIEFDSDETIDHFDTPWWNRFHNAVDNGDPSGMVDRLPAIALGLVGLDCQHHCPTELHPLLGLAMLVESTVVGRDLDQTWAIFMRNNGDEGYCSTDQHWLYLLGNAFRFGLPWPKGAASYVVLPSTIFKGNRPDLGYSVGTVAGRRGLAAGFYLAGPTDDAMIHGELHIRWQGFETVLAARQALPETRRPSGRARVPSDSSRVADVEEGLSRLAAHMTPAERRAYERSVRHAPISKHENMVARVDSTGAPARGIVSPPSSPENAAVGINCVKARRDTERLATLLRTLMGLGPPSAAQVTAQLPLACRAPSGGRPR
jgi:hypothetical protein